MARKVFISFLGTSHYDEGRYTRGSFISDKTRFIQIATLQFLQNIEKWNSGDKCIILLTKSAKDSNWVDKGSFRGKTHEYDGLHTELHRLNLPIEICPLEGIPDGNNEVEVLEIFSKLFNELRDQDELYFDVTHGFRSLPMLAIVLGNYTKFLKDATVKSITYGNWEARQEDTAPIVDLQILSSLQDWTFAAADYIENGNASQLSKLSVTEANQLAELLIKFTEDMQLCRGLNIVRSDTIKKISTTLNGFEEKAPIAPIVGKIKAHIKAFEKTDDNAISIKNGFVAAKWCYEHGMYQQAATILEENVVTFFCLRHNIKIEDERRRPRINKVMNIAYRNLEESKWEGSDQEKIYFAQILEDDFFTNIEMLKRFDKLTKFRNDINHSGMRNKPQEANELKEEINSLITYFSELLQ